MNYERTEPDKVGFENPKEYRGEGWNMNKVGPFSETVRVAEEGRTSES